MMIYRPGCMVTTKGILFVLVWFGGLCVRLCDGVWLEFYFISITHCKCKELGVGVGGVVVVKLDEESIACWCSL